MGNYDCGSVQKPIIINRVLFLPFDIYKPKQVKKLEKNSFQKVQYIQKKIDLIRPDENEVLLEGDEKSIWYLDSRHGNQDRPWWNWRNGWPEWHKTILRFYTYESAKALRDKLQDWGRGQIGRPYFEMPIKVPSGPSWVCFVADSF